MIRTSDARTYRLHDVRIAVEAPGTGVAEAAGALLALLRAEPDDDARADLRLTFAATMGQVPEGAEFVGRHERGVEVLEAAPALYLRLGATVVVARPEDGTATFHLGPSKPADGAAQHGPLLDLLLLCLLVLLRPRGLYLLHAACLVCDGAGLLVSAHSGSGKSTLATALASAGWSFLSDDLLLLRATPGGVEALGLGLHFRLLPDTLDRFPGLVARSAGFAADKHHLEADELFPDQYTPRCLPRVLVIPEIAALPTSEVHPLPASAALMHLLGQTTFLSRDRRLAAAHLDTLRRLALQVRPYRLRAGRDLYEHPDRAARLLAPLMTAS